MFGRGKNAAVPPWEGFLCRILDMDFREFNFYELGCIAVALSFFGLVDTIGTRVMGPALRS